MSRNAEEATRPHSVETGGVRSLPSGSEYTRTATPGTPSMPGATGTMMTRPHSVNQGYHLGRGGHYNSGEDQS